MQDLGIEPNAAESAWADLTAIILQLKDWRHCVTFKVHVNKCTCMMQYLSNDPIAACLTMC